jgi:hypothetical protein
MTMPNTPDGEGKDMSPANASFEDYANAVKTGNVAEAEAATQKIWQHLAETQGEEPSPWLETMQDAHRCEAAFDWPAAEEAYTRAVRAAADQPGLQCGAYRELSRFHRLFDREALALQTAHLATEAARRQNIPSMIAVALQVESALHLNARDYPAAWKLIAETFASLEEGPMHNLPRALAFLVRGEYLIEHERFPEAEADLTSAWGLMEPWSEAQPGAGKGPSRAGGRPPRGCGRSEAISLGPQPRGAKRLPDGVSLLNFRNWRALTSIIRSPLPCVIWAGLCKT